MRRLAASVVFGIAAQPALALSCMAPDLARDFQRASESDQEYVVVVGDFEFTPFTSPDPSKVLPPGKGETKAPARRIPARFEGETLSPQGFTTPLSADLTLEVSCIGPWCGHMEPGTYLAFMRRDAGALTLEVSACPSMIYADPTPQMRQTVTQCLSGRCG